MTRGRNHTTARACAQRGTRGGGAASPSLCMHLRAAVCAALACALLITSPVISVSKSGAPQIESAQAMAVPAAVPAAGAILEYLAELIIGASSYEGGTAALTYTMGSILGATTGAKLLQDGMSLPDYAASGVAAMVDVGQYPAWSNLSAEEQQQWGTIDNYNAYKWLLVSDSMGLGEWREGAEQWVADGNDLKDYGSTGGGSFAPIDEKLARIGNAVNNMALGGSITLEQAYNIVTNPNKIFESEGLGILYTNAAVINDVPVKFMIYDYYFAGRDLNIGDYQVTNTSWYVASVPRPNNAALQLRSQFPTNPKIVSWYTARNTWVLNTVDANNDTNGRDVASTLNINSNTWTNNVYWNKSNLYYPSNTPYDVTSQYTYLNLLFSPGYQFGDIEIKDGEIPSDIEQTVMYDGNEPMQDTPQEIKIAISNNNNGDSYNQVINNIWPDVQEGDSVIVKNPTTYGDTTTYNDIVSVGKPSDGGEGGEGGEGGGERPETNYNPDDYTGGEQWREDTTENVMPLTNIHFDKLFPFSMVASIPKLFHKVQGLTGTESASGEYQRIAVPVEWSQDGGATMTVDLGWLHDLLVMIRPVMQIFLAIVLLLSVIWFWRGILTGD